MKLLISDLPRVSVKEMAEIGRKLRTASLFRSSVRINFKGLEQDVFFDATPTNFGGLRLWLSCYWCNRRVSYLYYNHTKQLGCRLCYCLGYKSQYRKSKHYLGHERYEDEIKKIKKKLKDKYLKKGTKQDLKLKLMKLKQRQTYGQSPKFTQKRSRKV